MFNMVQVSPEIQELSTAEATIPIKKPKRVLYFSDGTIEEFSDSDSDDSPIELDNSVASVPETWGPWVLYKLRETGQTTLAACDYVGEALASFLGITAPKYQYELEEYKKMVQERKEYEEKKKGWIGDDDKTIMTEQPGGQSVAPTEV